MVAVAPPVPAPEDEAAAEPSPRGPVDTNSGVRPDARQPDGSRSLSTGHKGWTNSVSGNPKNFAVKIK